MPPSSGDQECPVNAEKRPTVHVYMLLCVYIYMHACLLACMAVYLSVSVCLSVCLSACCDIVTQLPGYDHVAQTTQSVKVKNVCLSV